MKEETDRKHISSGLLWLYVGRENKLNMLLILTQCALIYSLSDSGRQIAYKARVK